MTDGGLPAVPSRKGKYIVLDSGNELVNRLRGVLSGFFLGVLTDRVFVADITYQKDVTEGLLSALFEGPGYEVRGLHDTGQDETGGGGNAPGYCCCLWWCCC